MADETAVRRARRARSMAVARSVALAALAALLLAAWPARAAITGATGSVDRVSPPPSVAWDAYESDTRIRVFDEKQATTLTSNLVVTLRNTGTYNRMTGA